MKKKILLSAAVLALLTAPAMSAQAAGVLRSIGEHPVSSPLANVDELKDMMRQREGDIKAGMRAAGHADLFPLVRDYIARYPQTQINVVDYQPGQHIDWMLFRSNGRGRVKVAQNITWGGNAPLTVFEFFIDKNGQRYTFAVPLACGNLSLKEAGPQPQPCEPVIKEVVREVQVPGPERVVKVEVPGPERIVKVPGPERVVKVEVPGPERIVKVEVPGPTQYIEKPVIKEVVRTVEKPVQVIKYVEKPVVKYVDKPVIQEVVREVQVPGPARTVYVDRPVVKTVERPVIKEVVKVKTVETAPPCCSNVHFIADGSYLNQNEDAAYGMGRLGVMYDINQQFSFLALLGGAAKADGDAGEDAFVMDFLVQYNFFQCSRQGAVPSPFFMAAGLGAWMTSGDDDVASEDSGADLIAELGFRLPCTIGGKATTALFVEARSATDELDDFDDFGRLGGGLRIRF